MPIYPHWFTIAANHSESHITFAMRKSYSLQLLFAGLLLLLPWLLASGNLTESASQAIDTELNVTSELINAYKRRLVALKALKAQIRNGRE
jgi:hypothetical protein